MIRTLIKIPIFLPLLIIFILSGCNKVPSETIDENDTGEGKQVDLYVRQDGSNVIQDNNESALKWIDTGLVISGPVVSLVQKGKWFPWGQISDLDPQECEITTCSSTNDSRCTGLADRSTPIVREVYTNMGCYLSTGKGIYLLAAKPNANGDSINPNANASIANSPSAAVDLYTTHLGAFASDSGVFNVDTFWSCDGDSSISCIPISVKEKLIGSKLYVKVVDSYYGDNDVDINKLRLRFIRGVYSPGFISQTIKIFDSTIGSVVQSLESSIMKRFESLTRVSVLLYLVVTAASFLIGVVSLTQTEVVVRLLKIAIVLMLTSPDNSMTTDFLSLYQKLAKYASDTVANIVFNDDNTNFTPVKTENISKQFGYLAQYDTYFNKFMSEKFHYKILALLFTKLIWAVPVLYYLFFTVIAILFRAMLLYITAYTQIGFLTLIMPILVPTMLFKNTANIFKQWLKMMASSAMLIVITTIGMGIVLRWLANDFDNLLKYSVTLYSFLFIIPVWIVDDISKASEVVNIVSCFSAFIKAFICYATVEMLPKLSDSFTESELSPATKAFDSLWSGINNKIVGSLKDFNAKYGTGLLIGKKLKFDKLAKEVESIGSKIDNLAANNGSNYQKLGKLMKLVKNAPGTVSRPVINIYKSMSGEEDKK